MYSVGESKCHVYLLLVITVTYAGSFVSFILAFWPLCRQDISLAQTWNCFDRQIRIKKALCILLIVDKQQYIILLACLFGEIYLIDLDNFIPCFQKLLAPQNALNSKWNSQFGRIFPKIKIFQHRTWIHVRNGHSIRYNYALYLEKRS